MGSGNRKPEVRKKALFVIYVTAIAVLAAVYFSVPERKDFFEYQKKWWTEMWEVVADRDQGSGVGEKEN